jgi:transforming growth factor-beta-induced protein
VDAVTLAELGDALSGGTWTVFAPTNDVFETLPTDAEGNPVVVNPLLSNIITYHAIADVEVFAADLSDGQVVSMANGDDITVNVDEGTGAVSLTDFFGGDVNVTATDIRASNGVVHVIDGLLTPSLNLAEVATVNGFTTLVDLVVEAGLADAVTDPDADLTIFAPTNAAFEALSEVPAGEELEAVLLYHAVQGTTLSTDLFNGQQITTLQGGIVTVGIDGDTVTLTDGQGNTVNVTPVDVPANNGVIHVIDGVLLPPAPDAAN